MSRKFFVKDTDYATEDTAGVVKVGEGLEIKDGVLKTGGGGGSSPYIYMTQEEYEALEEYEQDRMYWVTYPCGDWLVWQNGEAILGQGVELSWDIQYPRSGGTKYEDYAYSIFTGKRIAIAFNTNRDNDNYCTPNLRMVDIAKGVDRIGSYLLSHSTNLTNVTIPDSVTTIGNKAFNYCKSLTNIVIPESVTTIEEGAFYNCTSLTNIVIPKSVTTIKEWAFASCTGIERVVILRDSAQPFDLSSNIFKDDKSLESIIYDGELRFPEDADYCFVNCTSLKTISCPLNFQGELKTSSSDTSFSGSEHAFEGCENLESVIISDQSAGIGNYAFQKTKLKEILIPSSVKSIGSGAFYMCYSLKNVSIGNGIQAINSYAFSSCDALETITINKPSGSISGAPWGATNATVVWTG